MTALKRLLKREGLLLTLYLTGLSILGVIAYQIGV